MQGSSIGANVRASQPTRVCTAKDNDDMLCLCLLDLDLDIIAILSENTKRHSQIT